MSRTANPGPDPVPVVILAGGRSSRMGRDKADVTLGGISLLHRIAARLKPQTSSIAINRNGGSPGDLPQDFSVFEDTVPGHAGPMAGVLSAMRYAAIHLPDASHVATVPTDTPFLPLDLLAGLQAALRQPGQIAVACSAGVMHPVFALWPVSLADELEEWLKTDEKRRVRAFIESHAMIAVDFPLIDTARGQFDPFFNINTLSELEIAESFLPLLKEITR